MNRRAAVVVLDACGVGALPDAGDTVHVTTPGTDHTREYAPLLAVGARAGRHDGPMADVGATVLAHLTGRDAPGLPGTPLALDRSP